MDPEIQREFEEQLRQMNDMLSQINSTMAGTVRNIQNQTAAISGNTTALRNQTQANDQLSTSVTGRTKLAEAESRAIEKTNEAKLKFKTAVDDSKSALMGFGRALVNTEEGFKKYGAAVEGAGEAAFSIGKNFGILGTILGGVVKGLTFFASEALSMHDTMIQMNRDFVKFTGVMPITTGEMANLAKEAGYAGENMGKFAKFAANLNQNIVALGATAGDGAVKFAKVAAVGNDVYEKYSKMGIAQEQLTEMQTYYLKEQAQSGRALALRTKSEEQLRKESLAYVDNMILLSSMTGQQAEDMQREREVVKSEFEERVKVRQEELQAQAAEARGDQAEADRIRAEAASRRAIIDKYTTLYGQEVGSMVGRVIRQGGFDEFTGGLAAAGIQVEELTGQMNAATKEQLEAQKRGASAEELEQIRSDRAFKAAEAYRTAQDNFALNLGDAAQYSKEVGSAFGQTAEALGRGENSIGKTVKEQYEDAKKAQQAKEEEARKNKDKDAAMRAEQETADRKFQAAWQDSMLGLARIIMPPITAATNLAADSLRTFNSYLTDINKFFEKLKNSLGTVITVLGVLVGATVLGKAISIFRSLGVAAGGLGSVFGKLKNVFSSAIGWLKNLLPGGGPKTPTGPRQDASGRWRDERGRFTAAPDTSTVSKGGKVLKFAKGLAGGLGGLLGGLALDYGAEKAEEAGYKKTAAGLSTGSSALTGAGLGATIGSVVFPGVGTVIGGAAGGVLGGAYGLYQNWNNLTGGVAQPKLVDPEKEAKQKLEEKASQTSEKQAAAASKNEATAEKTKTANEKTSAKNKKTTDDFGKMVAAFGRIVAANGKIVVAFGDLIKVFGTSVTKFDTTIKELMDKLSSMLGTAGLSGTSANSPATVDAVMAMNYQKESAGGTQLRVKGMGNAGTIGGGYGLSDAARRSAFESMTDEQKAKFMQETGFTKAPTLNQLVNKEGTAFLSDKAELADKILARQYTENTIQNLSKRLGRQPTMADVRGAHWLGDTGYARFMQDLASNPNMTMAEFYDKHKNFGGKRPDMKQFGDGKMTLQQFQEKLIEQAGGYGGGSLKDLVTKGALKLGGGITGNMRNLENMDPSLETALASAITEYNQKTGKAVTLTSGYRYPGDQEKIGSGSNPKAAPGMSRHERGLAVDINSSDVTAMNGFGLLSKYGLIGGQASSSGGGYINDPPHIELKAAKGGIFDGPTSGYPVELHGQEMVAPLTMDSILMKLAKTPALSAEGEMIEKAITGGQKTSSTSNENADAILKMHSELMNVLASKLDTMIDVLDDGNDTREKIFKHSMV